MTFTIETNTLYHTTERCNLESILKHGLKRITDKNKTAFIHLSLNPLSWRDKNSRRLVTLEVDIRSLKGKFFTTFLPELDEVLYCGDIPPRCIKVVDSFFHPLDL